MLLHSERSCWNDREIRGSTIEFKFLSYGCTLHGLRNCAGFGCKVPERVKSITLVAPAAVLSFRWALTKLAGKKLWPPLAFGCSFMSWYEHLGRFVCLIFCRNHRIWEKIMKLFTLRRDVHFLTVDLTTAWSSMHNGMCGGAKFMGRYVEILSEAGVRINMIRGEKEAVVPLECCYNLKKKAPEAEISIIRNGDHGSVILGREKEFGHYP